MGPFWTGLTFPKVEKMVIKSSCKFSFLLDIHSLPTVFLCAFVNVPLQFDETLSSMIFGIHNPE